MNGMGESFSNESLQREIPEDVFITPLSSQFKKQKLGKQSSYGFFKKLKKIFRSSKRKVFSRKIKSICSTKTLVIYDRLIELDTSTEHSVVNKNLINESNKLDFSKSEISKIHISIENKCILEFSESLLEGNSSCCRSSTILDSSDYSNPQAAVISLLLPEDLSMVKQSDLSMSKKIYTESFKRNYSVCSSIGQSYRRAISLPDEVQSQNRFRSKTAKGLMPKTFLKFKSGFLIKKRKRKLINQSNATVKPLKNFICKQSYRRTVPFRSSPTPNIAEKEDNIRSIQSNYTSTKLSGANAEEICRAASINSYVQPNDPRTSFPRTEGLLSSYVNGQISSLVNEGQNLPLVNERQNLPLVNEGQNLPLVNEGQNLPLVNEGQNLPLVNEGQNLPLVNEGCESEVLNYSYITVDNLFTALEHLHDHMELVRNGIQQLMDHFTNPPPRNPNVVEDKVAQFQHSIVMLQSNIEQLQFAVFRLPLNVSSQRNLLLPCNCKIVEFNNYVQDMSVDFEHAQYFNNDSPMLTMLKMIVIINLLRSVTTRGRRAFHGSIASGYVGRIEVIGAFNLRDEYMHYVKPTFDLLFTRTRGMVELSNLSGVLRRAWEQSMDWDNFLPFLHLYINMIETLKPLFVVPNDWFVVRVLPETSLMHTFDGFMTEFHRATVTPNFANSNPVAFGAIFNVMKYILDNIIEQHVSILADLRNVSTNMKDSCNITDMNWNNYHDYINLNDRSISNLL